jgi:chromosome segregation protein
MITELNRVSRKRFVETFEDVRSHFNGVFRKLFHGGRADIQLKEGEDVLETGIDIIAGPPRKDVRSISLLSGGERTLTAVALLFALFKARPSPFCLLDEVDAALDETNIERFCSLLIEYTAKSQFLIVTHSKRTMSHADFLYGVTMEEGGVTKLVGMKLEEYRERVA